MNSGTHPNDRRMNRHLLRHLRILAQLRIPLLLGGTVPTTATANLCDETLCRHQAYAQVAPGRYIVCRQCLDDGRRCIGCKCIAELGAKGDGLVTIGDSDQRGRKRRKRRLADWGGNWLPENRTRRHVGD